jgi:hypothetical protein
MQELFSERAFFDWLERVSSLYGDAMAAWGQAAQSAAAAADTEPLLIATDTAIERLVGALIEIGGRHDDKRIPMQGMLVLSALDRLLGGSVEFLEDARAGLRESGLSVLPALAPRVADLRALEAAVEQATDAMQEKLDDTYGDPGAPGAAER